MLFELFLFAIMRCCFRSSVTYMFTLISNLSIEYIMLVVVLVSGPALRRLAGLYSCGVVALAALSCTEYSIHNDWSSLWQVDSSEVVFAGGRYCYTEDLVALQRCTPTSKLPLSILAFLAAISTPLHLEVWRSELRRHPDRVYSGLILQGLSRGFRIGFDYACHSCRSAKKNMASAIQHPEPVGEYLSRELQVGRILGPISGAIGGVVHISRFGVIPKPHQPGKWRIITDLSAPKGASVNDGIDPALCSLLYASLDDGVAHISRIGAGTLLEKFDLESAYRLIPVYPEDRLLLGVAWEGNRYVDGSLPFGLRSCAQAVHSCHRRASVDNASIRYYRGAALP